MRGAYRVALAGFLSALAGGFLCLLVRGWLLDVIFNLLLVIGGGIGIGLAGMLIGSICGLSLRCLLEYQRPMSGWGQPVALATIVAGVLGFMIVYWLINILRAPL